MTLKFKIEIEGLTNPPVWRTVEVPANYNFEQFSSVIQCLFIWNNSKSWYFEPLNKCDESKPDFRIIFIPEGTECPPDSNIKNSSEITLDKIFPENDELVYTYDYDDNWRHLIKLESVIDENREYAVCADGKSAAPPENCGGIDEYEAMKKAFAERDEDRMETYSERVGLEQDDDWDPEFFNEDSIELLNEELEYLPKQWAEPLQDLQDWYGYFSMQELMKRKTIPELRKIAHILGIKFKSGAKKGAMLDDIAQHLKSNPESLVKCAYYYELRGFLDAIRCNMSDEYAADSGMLSSLNRFGMIYAFRLFPDAFSVQFQLDISHKMERLIPAELDRRRHNGARMLEKVALGCANIYGYTMMSTILQYLPEIEKRTGIKFDDDSLKTVLYPIESEMYAGTSYEYGLLMSPFAKSVYFYPDEEHIRCEITQKEFDLDTIMEYGEMPYPIFRSKEADNIREFFKKYGKKGCTPDSMLRRLWLAVQNSHDRILPRGLEYFNLTELDSALRCIDLVNEFYSIVPRWEYAGHTLDEFSEIKRAERNMWE